jgi:beta-lactamase regulating signal transducer with metallopeptidase domain
LFVIVAAPIITFFSAPAGLPAVPQSKARMDQLFGNDSASPKTIAVRPFGIGASQAQYLGHGVEVLDRSLPWMLQLWVIGVLGLSCRWFQGSWWIQHVRSNNVEPLNLEWLSRLSILSRRLDISRPVRLLKSSLIEVPMVIGWLRPVILIPASALSGLTPEQLEAILAHELAHVRRYDYLVNTFQNAVETLLFYHPAVWWISRCIREEREHCCDDLVVRVCGDRVTYARALVTLEEARGFPRLAFAATGGSLLHRVRRLLGDSSEGYPPSAAEFSGITLVAIGCVFIIASIWFLSNPAIYQSSALIKLSPANPVQTISATAADSESKFYPYLLQTECLVIRSPAVLGLAARSLGLGTNEDYNGRAAKPSNAIGPSLLKKHLNLVPVPSTSVIEIQASDSDPAEAANIANAVAAAYRDYRFEQRRKSFSSSLDVLESRFSDYGQKVREAQRLVDKMRLEFNIPDAVLTESGPLVSENMPAVILSAETLRHIEALRIESLSEYVKEKTLLERLEQLDMDTLTQTIPTIGIQDNQLTTFLESLALVQQRLVSMRKELGPEHTEVLKAVAQEQDLKQKIQDRTTGILKGMQAKVESTAEGLAALSNAVAHAQNFDIDQANRSRPYFEAKRDMDDLIRFRRILQEKIAAERADAQLPESLVEIIEEAVVPTETVSPNRSRGVTLLATGLVLAAIGWLLGKTGRHFALTAKVA